MPVCSMSTRVCVSVCVLEIKGTERELIVKEGDAYTQPGTSAFDAIRKECV